MLGINYALRALDVAMGSAATLETALKLNTVEDIDTVLTYIRTSAYPPKTYRIDFSRLPRGEDWC